MGSPNFGYEKSDRATDLSEPSSADRAFIFVFIWIASRTAFIPQRWAVSHARYVVS
jgi:hypothetical protein